MSKMKRAFYYSWMFLTLDFVEFLQPSRCEKLDSYKFPVFKTNSCPQNQSEWTERSNNLNCTTSHGYLCIPNENLTHLLEFCYTRPRIPVEEGICLILDRGTSNLDDYSCVSFISGCPNSFYWSSEIYKYQSCLSVQKGCFLADPQCAKEGVNNRKESDETKKDIPQMLLWIISGVITLILLIFGPMLVIRCRKTPLNQHYEEMEVTSVKKSQNDIEKSEDLSRRDNSDKKLDRRINETKQIIAHGIDKTKGLFVKTHAFINTLEMISSKNYVVIKGNMGDGKTTIAYQAINEKIKDNKKPLQIYSFTDFDELASNENNLVIFIDNMFGEFSTTEVSQWSCRFRALEAALGSNCLIITIRNDIYKQLRLTSDNKVFLEKAMIDISLGGRFELSIAEKRQIFAKYSPDLDISAEILEESTNIGFPQCCRILKGNPLFKKKLRSLFSNPEFLRKEIKIRISDGGMKAALLVFILLKGGKVKKTALEDRNIDTSLKTSVMNIFSVKTNFVKFASIVSDVEDTFVIYNQQEHTYEFSHSSVEIALFLEIGKTHPKKFIKHCHYACLSVVTTERCCKEELQTLCISEKYFEVLRNRVRELLRGQTYEVHMLRVISELPVWEDESFLNFYLENSDEHYCEKLDENGWSLVVHFAISGCLKWVKHIFENELTDICNERRKELTCQSQLALANACGARNTGIVEYLIKSGVAPDITCCFHAVKGGHLDTVILLVNHGVDLRSVCKTLSCWDTETTVLEEAALHKQDHLMIPLLKICPKLRDIKSSIGASAVHFAAIAGNMELLEDLIKEYNFTPYDITDIGSTILHFASQNNRFEAVKMIVERYPDLFEKEYYCYEQGTILHTGAQSGNDKLFKYLYEENLNYLAKHGKNSIELTRGCYVLIKGEKISTIDKSFLLHVRSRTGISMLHRAAAFGGVHIIDFLIKKGVDDISCTYIDRSGKVKSVFDVARNRETKECLERHRKQLKERNISEVIFSSTNGQSPESLDV